MAVPPSPPHEPKGSRTGILPVAGASSPSFVRGQDALGDRQDACPWSLDILIAGPSSFVGNFVGNFVDPEISLPFRIC